MNEWGEWVIGFGWMAVLGAAAALLALAAKALLTVRERVADLAATIEGHMKGHATQEWVAQGQTERERAEAASLSALAAQVERNWKGHEAVIGQMARDLERHRVDVRGSIHKVSTDLHRLDQAVAKQEHRQNANLRKVDEIAARVEVMQRVVASITTPPTVVAPDTPSGQPEPHGTFRERLEGMPEHTLPRLVPVGPFRFGTTRPHPDDPDLVVTPIERDYRVVGAEPAPGTSVDERADAVLDRIQADSEAAIEQAYEDAVRADEVMSGGATGGGKTAALRAAAAAAEARGETVAWAKHDPTTGPQTAAEYRAATEGTGLTVLDDTGSLSPTEYQRLVDRARSAPFPTEADHADHVASMAGDDDPHRRPVAATTDEEAPTTADDGDDVPY